MNEVGPLPSLRRDKVMAESIYRETSNKPRIYAVRLPGNQRAIFAVALSLRRNIRNAVDGSRG